MKSDDKVLSDFQTNVAGFLATSHAWRKESSLMYQIYDNRPLVDGGASKIAFAINDGAFGGNNHVAASRLRDKIISVVSVAPPYVKATIGMMAQYRKNFVAYSATPQYAQAADILNDAMQWGVDVSKFNDALTDALTDAAVTGLGGLTLNVRYDNPDYVFGVPVARCKRHLFYDRGAEHVSDVSWAGFADPTYKDSIDELLEKSKISCNQAAGGNDFRQEFMEYTNPENSDDIDFLVTYLYRQHEIIAYSLNPILAASEQSLDILEKNPIAYEFLNDFALKHNIDYVAEQVFAFNKEMAYDWAEVLKNIRHATGQELPETETWKGEQNIYYRTRFARGCLVEHSRSFTQGRHELLLLPAYYDRYSGTHYGLMRGAAYLQEAINEAMDNFREQVRRNATGGNVAITGGGTETKNIISDIRKGEQTLVLPQGAIITNLSTPDAAQANQTLAQMLIELVPVSLGISKEILGQLNTDTPAASLFQMAQKQMQVSLAHLMVNIDSFISDCGFVMRDAVKHIIKESKGVVSIPRGQGSETSYIELTKQKLLQNYVIKIEEQDLSKDQRHEEFLKLTEFVNTLAPEQRPAMLPALIELSTLDYESKQKFLQALQPQPVNPQMEELNMRERVAQVETLEGDAILRKGAAMQAQAEAKKAVEQIGVDIAKKSSEIDKNQAITEKTNIETQRLMMGV